MLPPTKVQAGQKDTETGVCVLHLTGSPSTSGFGYEGLKVEVPFQGRYNYLAMTAPHHHTPIGVGRLEALVYTVLMKWGETVLKKEH